MMHLTYTIFVKMFFDVSYKKKEVEDEIKKLVGRTYTFIEKLKMGGVGSQRFIVSGGNEALTALMEKSSSMHFCNIELRKKGVVIWFRIKLDNYALAIPYHLLLVQKSENQLRLVGGEWKIILSPANNVPLDNAFVLKMMQKKASP
jgi:hypothetical protein